MAKASKEEDMQAGPSTDPDMAYDPDQDPEERRGVRRDYRSLDLRFEGAVLRITWFISCSNYFISEGTQDGQPVNARAVIDTVKVANELFEKG